MAEADSESQTTGTNTANSTVNTANNSSEDDDDIYEVEKIVGLSYSKGKPLFKVRWAGYSPSWDTWEPYENLESCKDMVDEYARSNGKANTKNQSPENSKSSTDTKSDNGSDASKQSSKSKKSNYYYVDADGVEADTLKDKFWRNLEQGKINVFGNDMYSKVKNTGRMARPSSFKEVFQGKEEGPSESEPKVTKKRRLSKGKEIKKAEPKVTQKKKAPTKTKKTRGKKAVATVTSKTISSKTIITEETPPTPEVKPQRTKAQTARKRISRMLEQQDDSSSSKNIGLSTAEESDDNDDSVSEVLDSSANDKAPSEASYGSTEEELQAESFQTGNYHHEVEESVDDSQTQLEELYECDDLLKEEEKFHKEEESPPLVSVTKKQSPKKKEQGTFKAQPNVLNETLADPSQSLDSRENIYMFDEKKQLVEEEASFLETENEDENVGEDGNSGNKDEKLASPCKVVVKRIIGGSYKAMSGSESSREESGSEMKDEEQLQIETDANGNTKLSVLSGRKRKTVDNTPAEEKLMQDKKSNRKGTESKGKKSRGRKNRGSIEQEDVKPKEETEIPNRLPAASAGSPPIGPPAGAAQQAASLFRTKASVKIYDPTQTSSPNSSEQSHTPQTPDIRTPQTPITPEGSTQGQQPNSVSSNFSDTHQAVIHPSPSCSLPSPTTPRTPSTSGIDEVSFDLDLDEIDLSTWDSVMPIEMKSTEGLELSNTEFRQAVHSNNYDRVRQALNTRRKYDLEQPDSYGMTLAMVAAYFGYDDILELLVLSGADINARQKNGITALIYACQQGHRCTVELLILMGAHVNPHLSNGETALMKGVKKGNKHIVRLLLEHGANFAAQAQDNTALKFAKQLPNQNEITELLNSHIARITSEFESQVQITLNNTAKIQCALFSMQCFALCEAERFHITFNHDLQPTRPGVGMLLFIAHSKFTHQDVKCRFYGPCAVTSAILNGVTLSPLTEETNFVLSFSPLHHGRNDLDIHTVKAPKSKAKLVVCAYKAQLTMPPD